MQFGPDCEVDVLWPGNCEADVHRQVFHRAGLFAASFPFSSIFFCLCALHLPSGKFGLSYLGKATAAARAALPIANSVCGILGSKQSQCLGSLTCTQMLMYVIAHGGCMDTIRESANAWDL